VLILRSKDNRIGTGIWLGHVVIFSRTGNWKIAVLYPSLEEMIIMFAVLIELSPLPRVLANDLKE